MSPTGEPRWLDEQEMAAWLPLIRLVYRLPQALDRQLREEAGISHAYYTILATLSDRPDRTLSMGELARRTSTSPSRLTNAVRSMERHGWVSRNRCTDDRRIQFATLTEAGYAELERVAPGHVEEVRQLVFDRLTADQVEQLRTIGQALLEGLGGPERATP